MTSTSAYLNVNLLSTILFRYYVCQRVPLYFILFARLLPILVKYSLNLFTISDLSVTIESESLKYLGNDQIKFKLIKAFVII